MAALGCATQRPADADTLIKAAGSSSGKLDRIGLQLYTVRNEAARDLPATLARVAAIGYRDVEFAGYHGHSPAQVRDLLARNGLRAPSAHVPIASLRGDWKKVLDEAKLVGHEYVTIPWLDADRASVDSWKRIASEFNRGGAEARSAGLRFAYHNHDFEFLRIGDVVPFDLLLTETDPALVSFEMDIYWLVKAGHDPLDYFRRFPNRFSMVHAKDSSGPPEHRMVNVGEGTIDFRNVLGQGMKAGVSHIFVEHDRPTDAFDSIAKSYRHLAQLEL